MSADSARRDDRLVAVRGEFLADGSCRATVGGASLFTERDAPRSTLDGGAAADIAPPGYVLHQIECAVTGDDRTPGARPDAPSVLVTVYAREGVPIGAGRYTVRAASASAAGTAAAATRAGVAVFGVPGSRDGDAGGAGVRYLEGREGTLEITAVDGARIVGRFDVRAGAAWSM